ncbi:FKBP-type peptidyl-prolyl cis-trans isomerase [Crocinitomix catalasitica]|uniref:FKBP-type peptidyl-prolyl cis-trans isomerase n=1 Tax=Crocinitomix catalasitica TaxID=184607 RepID=UPI0004832F1D|nr:peptidylprolyl isomerase [Crocinitomix catalasitica]
MNIAKESVVTMNYTLKNDAGEVMDTSEGREPLVYLHGVGGLIPGLEKELEGKVVADKLNVVIAPEDAYGSRKDDLLKVVSKDGFQGEEELSVGMRVQLDTEQGPVVAEISDIKENDVTLDLNHPLADMTLHFDVEIVDVRTATADEIAHGHVHGEGGHQH